MTGDADDPERGGGHIEISENVRFLGKYCQKSLVLLNSGPIGHIFHVPPSPYITIFTKNNLEPHPKLSQKLIHK